MSSVTSWNSGAGTALLDRTMPGGSSSCDDDVETALQRRLEQSADHSMCVGSSTGEILGLSERIRRVREDVTRSPGMCFWGAFVK
jgi:hypothetical protein